MVNPVFGPLIITGLRRHEIGGQRSQRASNLRVKMAPLIPGCESYRYTKSGLITRKYQFRTKVLNLKNLEAATAKGIAEDTKNWHDF